MSLLNALYLFIVACLIVVALVIANESGILEIDAEVDEEPKSHLYTPNPQIQCAVFTYNGQLSNPACKWLFGSATFKEYKCE